MSAASRIRHSFVGRCARQAIHVLYHLEHRGKATVRYRLPGGVSIDLYPEGEIAEFLAFQRLFEQTELALVSAFLKPGMKVVDVGANIGLYSILADKCVGPSGTVWGFEPSPESFVRLKKNLLLNDCRRVEPFRIALSDRADTAMHLKRDRGFGDAYRYLVTTSSTGQTSGEELESVPVTTLDRWARENTIDRIDFLKVDIEGGEFHMLRGSEEVLRANPRIVVFFESEQDWCRRAGCRQQDAFALLENLGFGLYGWNNRARTWESDAKTLLSAGMVWAARDRAQLPAI
jgi:FkbM family methyltransferase